MIGTRRMIVYARLSMLMLLLGTGSWIIINVAFADVSVSEDKQSDQSSFSLQQIVDEAKPGDSIMLSEGDYSGPVVINKKLTIQGSNNAVLSNETSNSAITIETEGVVLQGISINHKDDNEESAAILIHADDVVLMDLSIKTQSFGIMLRDADEGIIMGNSISWIKAKGSSNTKIGQKGNGIDLYNAHNHRIEQNKIFNMRDGIYLENSRQLHIEDNRIYSSRYGIHCMYIDGSRIVGNIGENNFTGAMVMGVNDVLISNNSFIKQSQNVNSQGMLLYDVQTSLVEKNWVDGNRVGIYLEMSSNNELRENSVYRNFVGIQLVNAEGNQIHENDFVANVIEAEATNSKVNEIKRNYWDSSQGLDLNRDGISEIAYSINPFYQQVVTNTPSYQLFFQSPGMIFLSSMYAGNQDTWTTDSSPSMKLNMTANDVPSLTSSGEHVVLSEGTFMLITACMLLLTSLLTIIYSGVSKS